MSRALYFRNLDDGYKTNEIICLIKPETIPDIDKYILNNQTLLKVISFPNEKQNFFELKKKIVVRPC